MPGFKIFFLELDTTRLITATNFCKLKTFLCRLGEKSEERFFSRATRVFLLPLSLVVTSFGTLNDERDFLRKKVNLTTKVYKHFDLIKLREFRR